MDSIFGASPFVLLLSFSGDGTIHLHIAMQDNVVSQRILPNNFDYEFGGNKFSNRGSLTPVKEKPPS